MHTDFFLGANSGEGFRSLYDGFCRSDGDMLYLIKAGPGGGKSGFMRRIGEKAEGLGHNVEYILCSGDPDSLDGLYIPDMKLGLVDATAPHATEPRCFGYDSYYVNLGQFCRRADDPRIIDYQQRYRSYYTGAYAYLRAASELRKAIVTQNTDAEVIRKCRYRAKSAVIRELGKNSVSAECTVKRRFISAISCKGCLTLTDTVNKLCKRIYLIDDRFGLAHIYLDTVINETKTRCSEIIVCPSPLLPDMPEAVILPECSLGFVSSSVMKCDKPYRHVRLDALISGGSTKAHRDSERLFRELIVKAVSELSQAKEDHDRLEALYRPYIDYDSLTRFTDETIELLFA